ncbi:FtsK/SpoIIIE family protein [Streptomyces sp. C]|nr:FtsK/SpoIIIE family protein [Streptomyces sp. C]
MAGVMGSAVMMTVIRNSQVRRRRRDRPRLSP